MRITTLHASADQPLFHPEWKAPPVRPFASHLDHLEALVQRIADLVAAHIARVPEDARMRGSDREEYLSRALSFGAGEVPPTTRELWKIADRKLKWINACAGMTTAIDLPFERLADSFHLSQVERDILTLVAAPKVDPRYARHFSPLGRDYEDPSVATAIGVLSRSFEESVKLRRRFALDSNLIGNSLVLAEVRGLGEGDFLQVNLEVPRRVVGELLGESHVAEELVAFSRLRTVHTSLDQVVLPKETKDLVVSLVQHHGAFLERRKQWGIDDVITYGKALVLLFSGPPGTGKTMLANAVASSLGKRLFSIDASKLMETGRSFESNLDAVFREARLLDAVLFFDECEQIFASRKHGNEVMPLLLTRLEQFDGVAILATNMEECLDEALARRIVAKIDFRAPTRSERADIWRKHLPASLPLAPDVDVDRLAESFELTGGYIKNAVLAGVVRSVSRGDGAVCMQDLEHGARLQVRVDKNELEQIERPQAVLDDLVLPADLHGRIRRFVDAARAHSTVLTEWGLGRSLGNTSGLTALFSGASGTGKSMAAEAIATALDRPLLRCPLSTVMSKWVGETSRNIAQLFQTAREHRAVLLFDEADALFARRVNVRSSNDRFANAETGALLTQIERHSGVVILTTNCADEIDPAFERRLQLRLAFPFPDCRARTALWKQMLGQDAPLSSEVNVAQLGRAFELSGALIRNAVLSAALEAATQPAGARVITMGMLECAASEQLKEPAGTVVFTSLGSA